MTTKKKQLKKNLRQKRLKKEKNLRKTMMKRAMDKVNKKMMPQPEQKGFVTFIYKIWHNFSLFVDKIKCIFGIHGWRLCSGRIGQPKYACIRCWAKSKILWDGTGSKEHYKNKHKKQ